MVKPFSWHFSYQPAGFPEFIRKGTGDPEHNIFMWSPLTAIRYVIYDDNDCSFFYVREYSYQICHTT